MKKLNYFIAGLFIILSTTFIGCSDNVSNDNGGNTTVIADGSNGLDLTALGELAKHCKTAKDLEDSLNAPNSINNIDLDNDGNVDLLTVTEYGSGNGRGLSITDIFKNVEFQRIDTQEIATIQFTQDPSNTNAGVVNINGNQNVYGNNASYQSNFTLTDFLILSYLFSPHPYYFSPYGYYYRPVYYHPYRTVPYSSYSSRVSTVTRTTTYQRSTPSSNSSSASANTLKSPNSARNSSYVKKNSLSNPANSQRSFQVRDNSKPVGSGGFGKSNSSSPSASKSSGSGRSFGGGRSSGGGHSSGGGSHGRSDIRWKTNIAPLADCSNNISKLQPVSWNWKTKEFPNEKFDNKKHIGLIAQDVERVYPELVITRPDGYKEIQYEYLTAVLIEAVKDLQIKNAKQDSVINVLLQSSHLKNSATIIK